MNRRAVMATQTSGFIIEDGVLKSYHGPDRDIVIPEGVTRIARGAFEDALLAKSIRLPSSLRVIEGHVICTDVYGYKYKLEKVIAPSLEMWLSLKFEDDASNFLQAAGNLYFGEELVTEVTIPSSIKEIPPYAFAGCRSLKKVTVEEGVTSLGAGCFAYSGIESISLPQSLTQLTDGRKCYSLGAGAFRFCKQLRRIDIPPKVTEIPGDCFFQCENLREVTLPENLTRICSRAFSYCNQIEELLLPSGLKSIDLNGLEKLKRLILPEGLQTIGVISNCPLVEELIIPDSVTEIGSIAHMEGLRHLRVPGELKYQSLFRIIFHPPFHSRSKVDADCPNLELNHYENGLYIGNEENPYVVFVGVESPNEETITLHERTHCIACEAFLDCPNLKTVTLPRSVRWISNLAFSSCPNLERVIPEDNSIQCDRIFEECPKAKIDLGGILDCPIHVHFQYDLPEGGKWEEETTLTFSSYYTSYSFMVRVSSSAHYVLPDGTEVSEEYSGDQSMAKTDSFVFLQGLLENKENEEGIPVEVQGFDDTAKRTVKLNENTFELLLRLVCNEDRAASGLGLSVSRHRRYAEGNPYADMEQEELKALLALAREKNDRLKTTMILTAMEEGPRKPKQAPAQKVEFDELEVDDNDLPF